jgi:hypothetical protein
MDKNRITIQIFWCVLLLAFLGLGFLVQSMYLVYAVYVFLIVFIISDLLNRLWLSVVCCNRSVSPLVINEGQDVEVTVFVNNKFWLPVPGYMLKMLSLQVLNVLVQMPIF